MKINIGAGDRKVEGFVSCDYDSLSNPDYVFDLEKDKFPFEDNSVEAVIAHHVLEHLGEGYFHCLQEIYRVCKHEAMIDILVPHHRNDEFFDDPTHRRPITVGGLRLFSKRYNELAREQKVYASRLADYFNVNFEVVTWDYIPRDEYRKEFEGKPKEEVEKYLKQHNNIIDQVWVKLVVIKE
jgi:predicted SAM-dependent methyltransferase